MAEEVKPVVPPTEAPASEPVAAPAPEETKAEEPTPAPDTAAEPATEAKPAEAAAETTEEPAKAAEEAPKEEPKPIYHGTLGYATTPLSNIAPPKYHFFFGEDAVPADNFKSYIAKNKADVHHALAWSNETGKGLLYYVKDAAQKLTPQGVIPLSEVDEVAPKGKSGISLKTGTTSHTLKAGTPSERDGWLAAIKEKVDEAKGLKDEIVNSDTYKANVEKWGKGGAALLAASAAGTAAHATGKKSFEDRKARSKSADKERKDRSQSRSKKFFDSFRSKKEESKEETAATEDAKPEAAEATEAAAATEAPATEAVTEAPATEATAEAAPAEAATTEAAAPVEEAKKEETPATVKQGRRSSKFFDAIRGAISPTREKKAEDVIPPASEAAVAESAPVIPAETINTEEPAAEAAATETAAPEAAAAEGEAKAEEPAAEAAPAEEAAKSSPKERRRSSFFDTFAALRTKSEKNAKKAKDTVESAVAPDELKAEDAKAEEPAAEGAAATEEPAAAETAAAEPTTEVAEETSPAPVPKKENKFIGLLRNPSKALRGNKEAKKAKPAEKVDEVAETKAEDAKPAEEIPATTSAEPEKPAEPETAPVPEPEPVSTVPPSNPTVAATA